jgi:two-component system, NtrC family, sensor kinase
MKPAVLIVDDSLTVRMDLKEGFEAAGFTVTACATLGAARESLSQGAYSAIVLDVLLPDGDGIEFLKDLRDNPETSALAVLLLSTEVEVRDRLRGLATGADDYVGKPYDRTYVVQRAEELLAKREALPSPPRVSPRVLLIEDSATFRAALRAALETAGYAVEEADSGEEGLRLAAVMRPSAVIVDGVLPGLDGAAIIRRLRSDPALRRTPCLLLTSSGVRRDELEALEAGADTYVRKDEDLAIILARLAALLRASTQPAAVEMAGSLFASKKLLAVDGSPTYLEALSTKLRQEGYDIIQVRAGEEALALLAVQSVDCILLDMVMPGLSGQETCRRIKATWRGIPIPMLTACEDREAMIEAFDAGADDYIPKASEWEVLLARLRAQLRRRQFEEENREIREELLRKELEAAEARVYRTLAEERARLIQALESANKELEAFSYSVSHDLRAPLRAIDGFSRILLEEYAPALPPEVQRYLRLVCDNAQRMGALVDDLLALSRLGRQPLAKRQVALGPLVNQCLEELTSEQAGRKIEIALSDLPPCQADPSLLKQVFLNLLGNALKYTRAQEVARIEVGGEIHDGEYLGFVRDNGVGFDRRYAAKLFGVFQRLHRAEEYEGTGVGLAIVQRIIRSHGGRVWAEGEVGKGATFYFTLPLS